MITIAGSASCRCLLPAGRHHTSTSQSFLTASRHSHKRRAPAPHGQGDAFLFEVLPDGDDDASEEKMMRKYRARLQQSDLIQVSWWQASVRVRSVFPNPQLSPACISCSRCQRMSARTACRDASWPCSSSNNMPPAAGSTAFELLRVLACLPTCQEMRHRRHLETPRDRRKRELRDKHRLRKLRMTQPDWLNDRFAGGPDDSFPFADRAAVIMNASCTMQHAA